jgi:UDP-glucose 4-epimerase
VNDFRDISSIFNAYRFSYVFHFAALVGVKRTLEYPVMVLHDITGIKNILNLAKNSGVKRIYFSSSSEVYGEPVEFPQNEHTTPLNSRLPYTIFRFFNTYGPKQSKDFVMSKFINAALNNKDITIYGDGSQSRTFCYIDDNVDACLSAYYNNQMINDVVNIGTDQEISILDLAHKIIEVSGSKSKIVHLPALKEGDMTRRCPDNSKMKLLLNRPLTPIEQGIKILIESNQLIES